MHRYFLKLAYNGTDFHGWQRQENAHSVQQEIEDKLEILFQQKVEIVGCGRTDTGVHASCYYAHFDIENFKYKYEDLTHKLNSLLPKTIAIYNVYNVNPDAHARFDAISRSYEYRISKHKDPFHYQVITEIKHPLDIVKMNKSALHLISSSDFKSFCKIGSDVKTTICDVKEAYWTEDDNTYVFHITADRFLRNMVRAIVGTLIAVGQNKISEDDFIHIIKAKNRSAAGTSAPALGLFLTNVEYPKAIFI